MNQTQSSYHRVTILAGGLIILAGLAAYRNSMSAPFFLDDWPSITDNPTIRRLWPVWKVLAPPSHRGLTVSGRPLVNLSLAVNYALGGTKVRGYHALNLAIHILAGLTLFGIVRRTLARWIRSRPPPAAKASVPMRSGVISFEPSSTLWLALAIAVLWTLHPLQTESVTYVIQRAESLMGLFYLLTLYAFIRYTDGAGEWPREKGLAQTSRAQTGPEPSRSPLPIRLSPKRWALLSILACLLGMAAKEVMVSAPLLVLLYDRTFVAGNLRSALHRRGRFYLGLAVTWILLAYLALGTGNRGGTSGFGIGVSPWSYWLAQFPAVLRYLELALWPNPLIFDYGTRWVRSIPTVLPAILVVAALAAGTVVGLRRWPAIGFLGVWFFALLAPTSLVPGNRQTMAEHRMYLGLAAVLTILVMGIYAAFSFSSAKLWRDLAGSRRPSGDSSPAPSAKRVEFLIIMLILATSLGFMTDRRNRDYRSEFALCRDTVAKLPDNPFAQASLGLALFSMGRLPEAIAHDSEALRLNPDYAEAHNNLGLVFYRAGRPRDAIVHYREALRLDPASSEAHNNMGVALARTGNAEAAIAHYRQALQVNPDYAEACNNLGNVLRSEGRTGEAISYYERALRLQPDFSSADSDLGVALIAAGRLPEAIDRFEQAVRLEPDLPESQNNLGLALARAGRLTEAISHLEQAIRLKPDYAIAHYNLGVAFGAAGRSREALAQFEQATRLEAGRP